MKILRRETIFCIRSRNSKRPVTSINIVSTKEMSERVAVISIKEKLTSIYGQIFKQN